MKVKKRLIGLLVVALALTSNGLIYAQPDPNDAPMGVNPAARPDWAKMTPEQRRQAAQQFVEQVIRGSMTGLGYTDKTQQDEVVVFANEQEKLLEPVREKHRKVAQALLNKANDDDVAALMADLRASIEDASKRRLAAIAELNEKIKFSQKPRLEALLSMIGLTGNETSFIGGAFSAILGTLGNLAAGAADEAAKQQGAADAPVVDAPPDNNQE
jgi:hypothetical protein